MSVSLDLKPKTVYDILKVSAAYLQVKQILMQVSNVGIHVLQIILIIAEVLIIFFIPVIIVLSILWTDRQARNVVAANVECRRLESESRCSWLPQARMTVSKFDHIRTTGVGLQALFVYLLFVYLLPVAHKNIITGAVEGTLMPDA